MRRIMALPIVGCCLLLTACGGGARELADMTPKTGHLHVSHVKVYGSLSELGSDSTAVAMVTAQIQRVVPADAAGVGPVPATLSTVQVDRVLVGKALNPGMQVVVRQLGTGQEGGDVSDILLPGRQYLLFLHAFEFTKGQPTGEYTITGDAGAYLVQDGQFSRVSPFARDLPTSTTLTEVLRLVSQ